MIDNKIEYCDLDTLSPIKKYAFIYICQEGRLEIQSLLLTITLKYFLKCKYELIAAVPLPERIMGRPKKEIICLLEDMGVRIVNINNKLFSKSNIFNHLYRKANLYANKIFCLGVETNAEKLIFLDSDMLFIKNFSGDKRYAIPFNAKLVGMDGVIPTIGKWNRIYESVNLTMPNIRLKVTGFENDQPRLKFVPPYFNSGYIAVNSNLAKAICDTWLSCYKKLLTQNLLDVPFLTEQVALPLALHKLGITYEVMRIEDLPCHHYHRAENLKNIDRLKELTRALIKDNIKVKDILKKEHDWSFLVT